MNQKLKVPLVDIIFLFFLTFSWLIPSWYSGLTKKTFLNLPKHFTCFNIPGGLFPLATPQWPTPYIQVLLNSEDEWVTLVEEDYFQMITFGYRTRLFEILYLARPSKELDGKIQRNLAEWKSKKYEERTRVKPRAIRFNSGIYNRDVIKDQILVCAVFQVKINTDIVI